METIYDFLARNATSKSDEKAFTYIEDNGEKSQISFNDLHLRAQSIARYLTAEFKAGSRVVLLFPPGLEYIQAFLGCLYAGIVAVPLYPPQSKKHAGRVVTVIEDCQACLILTNKVLKEQLAAALSPLPVMGFDELLLADSNNEQVSTTVNQELFPTAKQIAFLQYTSGSTGTPKGVVVSHGNIIANLKTLQQATDCSKKDVFCNWLPLFHDLGLVNTLLLPIFLGAHSVLMSPVRFIKNPLTWFTAIAEFKGSICGAPNFAFDHCLERIKPHQLAGINLSSWRIAFNAAEPVDAETLMRFSDRFSRVGFKESAIFPAYGMAEATVFICGGTHASPYLANPFSSESLQNGEATISEDLAKQQILIAHGNVQSEHHLKIVSPETRVELPEGQVGEIWFAGPSLAQGYWNDPEKTKASFRARLENDENNYLRTGDLGFMHQGELYISGRIKDVMIIKGRNYYPQDFEKLAYNIYPGLSQNGASAFEVNGKAVLLLELNRNMMKEFDFELACHTIKAAIFEQFEVLLEDIVFLKAGRINRTSSGKIQRSLTKKRYLANDFDYLYKASSATSGQVSDESRQRSEPTIAFVSELETQLCEMWQEVFGIESIGVEDNFLDLGGHSLLATTLIAQIQKKWRTEISVRDFLTANTIRKLAKVVETASESQLQAIKPVAITDSMLASHSQERMWLVNQIESDQAQYNLSFSVKLLGEINETFLLKSFKTILMRHKVLRTTYSEINGQVYQRIQESFQFDIPIVNLSDLAKSEQESRIVEIGQEEARKIFDLSRDVMLRVSLIKLNPQSHIMLLTAHHIAVDGWSLDVLMKELNTSYSAYVHGLENPLPPLEIQYVDYAYWQRDQLKEEVLQNHLGYWKEHLGGLPVVHGLPLDNVRPAVQTFEGSSVQYTLVKELREGLYELARENKATLFMLLNAALASFLSRYSGETDIVIGTPIANREQAEVAPLIGLFINNLVFRSDLSSDPTFVDLLRQSKERTFAAYEHQQMPFEKLVDELQPERSLSHSPLFQVMLNFQNQDMEPLDLAGLEAKQIKSSNIFAQYDLTLVINESDNGLEMEWQYASDLFSKATIERMIGHFETLLQGIIEAPKTKVSLLPLIDNEESNQLFNTWNSTTTSYAQDKCFHELFEEQVNRNPDAIAAVFNKEQLSYSELNQRANRLAHYLVKQGVTPDSLVGIYVERSIDMLVGVLAIMKSGGAYLPLDPAYPKARLEYMIEDSHVKWVITQKNLVEKISAERSSVKQVFCLDDKKLKDELSQLGESDLNKDSLGLTTNNLAYVIYTSGSTGKPKGVMLEHHSVTNFLSAMRMEPGLTNEDTLLAVTSLSFDIHVLELFLPLVAGGQVVIASSESIVSPDELANLIEGHQITTMQATPATWKMLVNNDWQPQNKMKVLCGGEALSNDLKEKILALESIELWNMYGPTETAVWSATSKIEDAISLGAPIANTQFYVLDNHLNPLPVGVAGELHIGGEGVSRGYLNRQELTEQKFIRDPFSDVESARVYKTGDLVRWLPDGTLEFLRRIDLQVKVRGHRIELGEIESGLRQHPCIQEAVATVRIEDGIEYIVAYVTGKFSETESELREKLAEYLKAFLPAYMLPNQYVCLKQIPLTANGKINRKALPKPQFNFESEYVAPQTEVEKQLCEIWQLLLNLQVKERKFISVNSNFFYLGGHSLLAARLVALIRQKWQVEVTIRMLFSSQTIREQASLIEKSVVSEVTEILPTVSDEAIPLSFAQQRLWLIEQIEKGTNQYNMCQAFRLDGDLDLDAMTSAFKTIIERHLVLRTTIQTTDSGEAIQVVSSDWNFTMPVMNLSDLSETQQEQFILDNIAEESSRSFALDRDLMMRTKLLKLADDAHVLLVTMHHIAVDGWSVSIIFEEFNRLYHSPNQELPQINVQYGDYARWQKEQLQGEVLDNHLSFWKARLQDLPEVHNLATDRVRPPIQDYQGAHHLQFINADIQRGLYKLAKATDTTPFMVLQTALAILLAKHSDKGENKTDFENIVIGVPVANREQAELAPLVGFFTNSVVLQNDLSGNPKFTDLLQLTKENLLDVYAHTQLPFEKLVDELKQERNLSYSPLFQVKLALQNNEQKWFDLPGISAQRIEQPHSVALHDLSLDIFELEQDGDANGLKIDWEYATALFDATTIERMAKHFEVLLKGIIDSPQAKINELSVLSSIEIEQLLEWSKWPPAKSDSIRDNFNSKKDVSVLELFEEQVLNNPDTIAIMFNESNSKDQLTYQSLNAKANQVAHYLLEQEVTADTLVGLCVERSLEMIIGMWGILKAGAAYVPIDPDYPEKHIEHILEDSGIEIVLTSSELLSELPFDELQILPLDAKMWEGFLGEYSESNVLREEGGLSLNDLAYVIYTSGSTGLPKGVAVEHGSLAQSTLSRLDVYQESPSSFALFSSFAFDSSIVGIFWTLVCGGKLCIVNIKQGVDLAAFESMMQEEDVSHFLTLPSVYQAMLSAEIQPGSSLKTIIVAGEACDQSLVEQHQSQQQWQECRLFNEYGPTEACVWSSYYDCSHHSDGVVPIGTTVPHAELFVLDSELQLCPQGVTGELYVGGKNLARCYLNAPELTRKKFIPSPFCDQQRLYKTGDLVRCLPDKDGLPGKLEFIGRLDHQVKIRGFRIELGEIEAAIVNYEQVADAVVIAKSIDPSHDSKQLVAYVVPNKNNNQDDDEWGAFREALQTYLTTSLLSYKVPSVFVVLDKLPLTPNGKVNREALQAQEVSAQLTHQYVEPTTEIEKQLCEIWQSLLKVQRVGVTDNFFAIGGDSILAIQAVARAAKDGLVFTTRHIFECQTIDKLALEVNLRTNDSQLNDGLVEPTFDLMKNEYALTELQEKLESWKQEYPTIEKLYRTTGMQQGMLFHSCMDASAYVSQLSLTLKGKLNSFALKQALKAIISRHDIYRTVFTEDFTYQLVLSESNLPFTELDWSDENNSEKKELNNQQRLDELLEQDKSQGFNAKHAPLMRITLVKLSSEKHCLIWSNHHALTDGWSLPLVFKEIMDLYIEANSDVKEQLSPSQLLSVLPQVQPYGSYISWLEQQDHDKARDWWQKMLADVDAPTDINVDSKVDIRSFGQIAQTAKKQTISLSAEKHAQLKSLAKSHQVTLNTLVQATWAYLLYRYSGAEKVIFGETISGRPAGIPDVEQIVGLFINSLPVQVNIAPEQKISDWLQELHCASIDRVEYGFLPLSEIQNLSPLSKGTDKERNLFDTLLVFENYPVQEIEKVIAGSDLIVSEIKNNEQTNYGLTLTVLPENTDQTGQLNFELGYRSECYKEDAVTRILEHLQMILAGLLEHSCKTIGELSILTAEEEKLLLVDWNCTESDYPQDKCIHELFEEQAERNPNAIAAIFNNQVLTYSELNQRSNQLARYLVKQGVKTDSLVGVCVERSLDMLVAVLAILKSGGAYLPLDPSYPKARLEYMVLDSGVQKVITQKSLADQFSSDKNTVKKIICLNDENLCSELNLISSANLDKDSLGLTSNHLAYLIYTSGSTGNPKGVMLEHNNLTNFLTSMQTEPGLTKEDVLLAVTSLSFDIHVLELHLPLIVGGRVVIASSDNVLSPNELAQLIEEHQVTSMQATPATWKMLVSNNWQPRSKLKVLCGGEALSNQLKDELLAREMIELWNMYGPTETAVWSATQRIDDDVTLGAPIANTQFYVLDSQLKSAPIGVAGELYIGGEGVARGYFNQSELTAERFIKNPFIDDPMARIYKTGDLVRWLPDSKDNSGHLQYIGRIDHQVKIRGHRIELGEIESRLNQHVEIKDSVVIAKGQESKQQLIAFYLAKGNGTLELLDEDLKEHLQQSLPEYMLPNAFVGLENLPLMPNGKVNRRALESMELSLESKKTYLAPRNDMEQQLVEIWAEILTLKPETIGINDSFFELGGHSLLATQVITKIRSKFVVDLHLKSLFEHESVAGLANLILKADKSKLPAILPVDRTELLKQCSDALPLSYVQERLWFIEQLDPDSANYNNPGAVTIKRDANHPLEICKVEQAINLIIARHENLRTVFPSMEGNAQQVILERLDFKLDFVDLSEVENHATRNQQAQDICQIEASTPFDVGQAPLIRGKLIKLSDVEHIFVLNMHHIISDNWSMGIIIKEFRFILEAIEQGQTPELPPLPIQYLDYSIWQRKYMEESGLLQNQLDYWQEKLAGVEERLNLATDYPRPSTPNFDGATVSFSLGAELTNELNLFTEAQDSTLYMSLQAVFKALLHRYTGQEDISFGGSIANRRYEETEGLVGMFANTLVFRDLVEGSNSFTSLLAKVKHTCLEAYEHQDTPFEKIVDLVQPERTVGVSPLFQVMFVLHNIELGLSAQDIQDYPLDLSFSRFDLIVHFTETPSGLEGMIVYKTALFKQHTIERMSKHFVALCRSIVANPEAKVSELEYLEEPEKQKLLIEFNDNQSPYPLQQCIHQLFAKQADISPDKIAVVEPLSPDCESEDKNKQLTFKQLNEQSLALALYLQSLGVKPDSLVGLCVDRSLEMMLGILSILKAGGAYVPLDPDYPYDRLSYMLEDSQADIIITQERHQAKVKALEKGNTQIIVLDEQGEFLAECMAKLNEKRVKLREDVKSNDLAYVTYTSGSTGRPKGVMIEHGMVIDYCYSVFAKMDLHLCETFAAVSSFSSDLGNLSLFVPMLFSKSLYLFSNDYVNSPIELHDYMDTHPIDCMKITPSHFEMFKVSDTKIIKVSKALIFAGEPLTKQIVDSVNSLNPDCKIFNNYGPTETTISKISSTALTSSNTENTTSIYLGKPLNNTLVYILDQNNNPVPVGVPGELHIAGDGVARGYLNQHELTAENFVASPFDTNARMYKSGDLARWLDDGNIEYLGRIDTQVKIRGFRIETAEIEVVLNQHPEIKNSVVVAQTPESDEQGIHKQLVCFYVANNETLKSDNEELKEHLLQSLPEYMIPMAFVCLEETPLMSNGKVDRRALELMNVNLESGQIYLAPRNALEEKLVQIWSEILQIEPEKIGVNDDFFSLGGHSLLAVLLVSKLKKELEISLPLQALFNLKTICGTADYISANATLSQLETFSTEEGADENDFVEGTL